MLCRGLTPTTTSITAYLGEQYDHEGSWVQSVEIDLSGMNMLEVVILAIPVGSSDKIETVCKGITTVPNAASNYSIFNQIQNIDLFLTANNKWDQFSSREAVDTLTRLPCIGKLQLEIRNTREGFCKRSDEDVIRVRGFTFALELTENSRVKASISADEGYLEHPAEYKIPPMYDEIL